MKVAVIGSGVIGLSTGILLARNSYSVTIYTKVKPPQTASNVACAIWLPILMGDPNLTSPDQIQLYRVLAEKSWKRFVSLVGNKYGIYWTRLHRMFSEREPRPYFADIVPNFEESYDTGLPSGMTYRWSFDTLVIETPTYMPALMKDFEELGGKTVEKNFGSIDDIMQLEETVVFNCAGLGAREIIDDLSMYPVKGQLIFHEPLPLDFSLSFTEYCLIPRTDALILGALFETEFDTPEPTEIDTDRIWSTIQSWVKDGIAVVDVSSLKLSKDKIRTVLTGLRPYRPQGVRLEAETIGGKIIIHDYGHGGSGITFSWGCAEYSVEKVKAILQQ